MVGVGSALLWYAISSISPGMTPVIAVSVRHFPPASAEPMRTSSHEIASSIVVSMKENEVYEFAPRLNSRTSIVGIARIVVAMPASRNIFPFFCDRAFASRQAMGFFQTVLPCLSSSFETSLLRNLLAFSSISVISLSMIEQKIIIAMEIVEVMMMNVSKGLVR